MTPIVGVMRCATVLKAAVVHIITARKIGHPILMIEFSFKLMQISQRDDIQNEDRTEITDIKGG